MILKFLKIIKGPLKLFQKKDIKNIRNFYSTVIKLINSSKDAQFKDALYPILASRDIIHEILLDLCNYHLDLTFSGFINPIDNGKENVLESITRLMRD